MAVVSFCLLALVLLVVLTAIVGGILDLPSLAAFRMTLAQRKVRLLALVVAAAPTIVAALDLRSKVASVSSFRFGFAIELSLIGGSFLSAAFAGCWLAMDESNDPHSRPKAALIVATVFLLLNTLTLHYLRIF